MSDSLDMIHGSRYRQASSCQQQTVLDLHNDLVCQGGYKFLITGRLTQDCIENLFSCTRGKGDSHPTPIHFQQNLQIVSLSQYMQITPSFLLGTIRLANLANRLFICSLILYILTSAYFVRHLYL